MRLMADVVPDGSRGNHGWYESSKRWFPLLWWPGQIHSEPAGTTKPAPMRKRDILAHPVEMWCLTVLTRDVIFHKLSIKWKKSIFWFCVAYENKQMSLIEDSNQHKVCWRCLQLTANVKIDLLWPAFDKCQNKKSNDCQHFMFMDCAPDCGSISACVNYLIKSILGSARVHNGSNLFGEDFWILISESWKAKRLLWAYQ